MLLRQVFNECKIPFLFHVPIQTQCVSITNPDQAVDTCVQIVFSKAKEENVKDVPKELMERLEKRIREILCTNSKLHVILKRRMIHFLVDSLIKLDLKSIALQQFEKEVLELRNKVLRLVNVHTNVFHAKYKEFLDSIQ